jgi:hypothetical protein
MLKDVYIRQFRPYTTLFPYLPPSISPSSFRIMSAFDYISIPLAFFPTLKVYASHSILQVKAIESGQLEDLYTSNSLLVFEHPFVHKRIHFEDLEGILARQTMDSQDNWVINLAFPITHITHVDIYNYILMANMLVKFKFIFAYSEWMSDGQFSSA